MGNISGDELKEAVKEVRSAVQDCFGIIPTSMNGRLTVSEDKYNELAKKLNKLTLKVK